MNAILKQLEHLGVHEKLQLVEDLWDSIDAELLPPMDDALVAELDRRAAWAKAHPASGCSLDELLADMRSGR